MTKESKNKTNLRKLIVDLIGMPIWKVTFPDNIVYMRFGKIHTPPWYPDSKLKAGDIFLSIKSAIRIKILGETIEGYLEENTANNYKKYFLETIVEEASLKAENVFYLKTSSGAVIETFWQSQSDNWLLSGCISGRKDFLIRKLRIKDISD